MTVLGSNSGFAAKQLITIVERIERLNEEKDALGADIREVFSEAKTNGFDTKILRRVIALRKMDTAARQEMEAVLELYMAALDHSDQAATAKSYEQGE